MQYLIWRFTYPCLPFCSFIYFFNHIISPRLDIHVGSRPIVVTAQCHHLELGSVHTRTRRQYHNQPLPHSSPFLKLWKRKLCMPSHKLTPPYRLGRFGGAFSCYSMLECIICWAMRMQRASLPCFRSLFRSSASLRRGVAVVYIYTAHFGHLCKLLPKASSRGFDQATAMLALNTDS